jgi:hypothetical protein
LVQSGPDLSLLDYLLLQHFYAGLDKDFWRIFGTFNPTEGKEVLNKIMDKTSFICVHELPLAKSEVRQEEVPVVEFELTESQSIDLTPEPSPELKHETPEEQDP